MSDHKTDEITPALIRARFDKIDKRDADHAMRIIDIEKANHDLTVGIGKQAVQIERLDSARTEAEKRLKDHDEAYQILHREIERIRKLTEEARTDKINLESRIDGLGAAFAQLPTNQQMTQQIIDTEKVQRLASEVDTLEAAFEVIEDRHERQRRHDRRMNKRLTKALDRLAALEEQLANLPETKPTAPPSAGDVHPNTENWTTIASLPNGRIFSGYREDGTKWPKVEYDDPITGKRETRLLTEREKTLVEETLKRDGRPIGQSSSAQTKPTAPPAGNEWIRTQEPETQPTSPLSKVFATDIRLPPGAVLVRTESGRDWLVHGEIRNATVLAWVGNYAYAEIAGGLRIWGVIESIRQEPNLGYIESTCDLCACGHPQGADDTVRDRLATNLDRYTGLQTKRDQYTMTAGKFA